jgi:hypothetical protein
MPFWRRAGSAQQEASAAQLATATADVHLETCPGSSGPRSAGSAPGSARRPAADEKHAAPPAEVDGEEAAYQGGPTSWGPPLLPLLPHEELLTPAERALRLRGFGEHGCGA